MISYLRASQLSDDQIFNWSDFRERPGLNIVGNNLLGQNVTNVACGDSFTICSTSENLVFSWGCSTVYDMNRAGHRILIF